jgi:hypothetical protein
MINATIMHFPISDICFAVQVPTPFDPYHIASETLHQDLPHPTLGSVSEPCCIGLFALFLEQSGHYIGS